MNLALFISMKAVGAYEVDTHEQINLSAADISVVDAYLKGQLRLTSGLEETFKKVAVRKLIGAGGIAEDNGIRWMRHFYNPLSLTWKDAGLVPYTSSILWAQTDSQEWSWHDTRQFYFDALTATESDKRDAAFYDTFLGLGHVIHLIEDASVPAHTRNDPHPFFYNYESWANIHWRDGAFQGWLEHPIFPQIPLNVSVDGYVPITQLWDTNQYDGTKPLTGIAIGIAEYSNANFVSDDTILTEELDSNDPHYIPFPSRAHLELWDDVESKKDPNTDEVKEIHHSYLRKAGEGETVDHFLASSWIYWYRLRYFPDNHHYLPVGLDDKCYYDQAQFLVPRAVGYSAALLNYFFRGIIYGDLDSVKIDEDRKVVSLKVFNATPGEGAGDGFMVLVAKFQPANQEEITTLVSDKYSVSDLPHMRNAARLIEFQFRDSIPSDALKLTFTIVFRGHLGAEKDAVVANVVRKITDQHVFVVQEGLSLNGGPKEYLIPYDYKTTSCSSPDSCITQRGASTGSNLLWDLTHQILSGRFVAYGEIKKILLNISDPCQGSSSCFGAGSKFYINGQLMSDGKWEAGRTPTAPETWQLVGVPAYYVRSPLNKLPYTITIDVTMADSFISLTRLSFYDSVQQWNWKWIAWQSGSSPEDFGGGTLSSSGADFKIFPSWVSEGVLDWHDIFDVVQFGGFAPVYHQETRADDSGMYFRDTFSADQGGYSDTADFTSCGAAFCHDGTKDQVDIWEQLYSDLNPQPKSFTINGLLRRKYIELELNELIRKNIPPENYDLVVE